MEKFNITEVRLNLGALGHSRRKPTTLGTNIMYLHRLEGLCDHRRYGEIPTVAGSLGDRTAESRSWAAWPLDFKIEISKGILLELDGPRGKITKHGAHVCLNMGRRDDRLSRSVKLIHRRPKRWPTRPRPRPSAHEWPPHWHGGLRAHPPIVAPGHFAQPGFLSNKYGTCGSVV